MDKAGEKKGKTEYDLARKWIGIEVTLARAG